MATRIRPGLRGVLLLAVCGLAAGPTLAQTAPRGPTTPGSTPYDRLREETTRPVPRVAPPPARAPGSDLIWVPDRYTRVPGEGNVHIPGHWEQRVSDREVIVPPLTGRTEDGRVIQLPAGRQPPPEERP